MHRKHTRIIVHTMYKHSILHVDECKALGADPPSCTAGKIDVSIMQAQDDEI